MARGPRKKRSALFARWRGHLKDQGRGGLTPEIVAGEEELLSLRTDRMRPNMADRTALARPVSRRQIVGGAWFFRAERGWHSPAFCNAAFTMVTDAPQFCRLVTHSSVQSDAAMA